MEPRAATAAAKKRLSTQLGLALLQARIAKAWSIQDLARHSRWSRSFLTLLENGKRRADPTCLIDLAKALGLEPFALLYAAYQDERAARDGLKPPMTDNPWLVFNYRGARELQESQYPYRIGRFTFSGVAHEDGSLEAEREYERCRPSETSPGLSEFFFQERITGLEVEDYGGDTFEILQKPEGLDLRVSTERNEPWLKHRIIFPDRWSHASQKDQDEISVRYRRRYEKVYESDPLAYLDKFQITSVEQAFVGKATVHLPHLVDEMVVRWRLPERAGASSWRMRIWCGLDQIDSQSLAAEGVCGALDMKSTTTECTVTLERPLAGYTYSLQWIPAELEGHLARSSGGHDAT